LFVAAAIGGGALWPVLSRGRAHDPSPSERAHDRSPGEIVREFDAIRTPFIIDPERLDEVKALWRKQCDLAWELYECAPRHKAVSRLMCRRWCYLNNTFFEHERVLTETEAVLSGVARGKLATVARRDRAHAAVDLSRLTADEKISYIEPVLADPHEREYGAFFLLELATRWIGDPARQRSLCERIVRDCSDGESVGEAKAHLAALEHVGQHIPLHMTEAVSGRAWDIADVRGKRVLVYLCDLVNLQYDLERRGPALETLRAWHADPVSRPLVVALHTYQSEDDLARVRTEIEHLGIPWPCLLEQVPFEALETSWSGKLGITSRTHFVLLDEDGRLVALADSPDVLPIEAPSADH
jgi:hypothetical protein